jgi:hypothetical protein
MGMLYYIASEGYRFTAKQLKKHRQQRKLRTTTLGQGTNFAQDCCEASELCKLAEELLSKKSPRQANLKLISAHKILDNVQSSEGIPDSLKLQCAEKLSSIFEKQEKLVKDAIRGVQSLTYKPNTWRTNIDGITHLKEIVTVLDQILYTDGAHPDCIWAEQYLHDQQHTSATAKKLEEKKALIKKAFQITSLQMKAKAFCYYYYSVHITNFHIIVPARVRLRYLSLTLVKKCFYVFH